MVWELVGGESGVTLLTDAGNLTTCGGDGLGGDEGGGGGSSTSWSSAAGGKDEELPHMTAGGGGIGGATESGPPVGTARLSKNARAKQARRERERADRASRR